MKTSIKIIVTGILFALSAFPRAPFSGYAQQGGQTVSVSGLTSTTKVQQTYPGATITVYYNGGPSGVVSTSGTAVTFVSGTPFNANGQWNGLAMTINSVGYTISSCSSSTSCTLTSSAGTQTDVTYSMSSTTPAAIFADNSGTPLANPFTANGTTGAFVFYADNGCYVPRFSGTGIASPFSWSPGCIYDPASSIASITGSTTGALFTITQTGSGLALQVNGNSNFAGDVTTGLVSGVPSQIGCAFYVDSTGTDLGAQINNALAASEAPGCSQQSTAIYVSGGDYSYSTGIVLARSGAHIICQSHNAVFDWQGGAGTYAVTLGDGANNYTGMEIEGCSFKGAGHGTAIWGRGGVNTGNRLADLSFGQNGGNGFDTNILWGDTTSGLGAYGDTFSDITIELNPANLSSYGSQVGINLVNKAHSSQLSNIWIEDDESTSTGSIGMIVNNSNKVALKGGTLQGSAVANLEVGLSSYGSAPTNDFSVSDTYFEPLLSTSRDIIIGINSIGFTASRTYHNGDGFQNYAIQINTGSANNNFEYLVASGMTTAVFNNQAANNNTTSRAMYVYGGTTPVWDSTTGVQKSEDPDGTVHFYTSNVFIGANRYLQTGQVISSSSNPCSGFAYFLCGAHGDTVTLRNAANTANVSWGLNSFDSWERTCDGTCPNPDLFISTAGLQLGIQGGGSLVLSALAGGIVSGGAFAGASQGTGTFGVRGTNDIGDGVLGNVTGTGGIAIHGTCANNGVCGYFEGPVYITQGGLGMGVAGTVVIDTNQNGTFNNLTVSGTCTGCSSTANTMTTTTAQTVTGTKTFSAAQIFNGALSGTHAQNLGTSDTPTFGGITNSGNQTIAGTLGVSGSTTVANLTSSGTIQVSGTLNMAGTITGTHGQPLGTGDSPTFNALTVSSCTGCGGGGSGITAVNGTSGQIGASTTTGVVTLTNLGVLTVNGSAGAITNVAFTNASNTFSAAQTFNGTLGGTHAQSVGTGDSITVAGLSSTGNSTVAHAATFNGTVSVTNTWIGGAVNDFSVSHGTLGSGGHAMEVTATTGYSGSAGAVAFFGDNCGSGCGNVAVAVAGGALDLSLGAKLTFSGTTAIDASRNGSFANLSFSGTGPYTTTGCASISGTVINTTGCGGSGSGTVTSVATTGPITGGTITSTGTIDCPTCVTVLGGGTLTAGTGVSLSGSTLSIGQNVSTSSAVSFNQVTTSSYVQAAYFQVPGYIFVDGSANITANSYHIGATPGYTGSTCSAWQSGLCVAP